MNPVCRQQIVGVVLDSSKEVVDGRTALGSHFAEDEVVGDHVLDVPMRRLRDVVSPPVDGGRGCDDETPSPDQWMRDEPLDNRHERPAIVIDRHVWEPRRVFGAAQVMKAGVHVCQGGCLEVSERAAVEHRLEIAARSAVLLPRCATPEASEQPSLDSPA